jgi:hypothetical protein
MIFQSQSEKMEFFNISNNKCHEDMGMIKVLWYAIHGPQSFAQHPLLPKRPSC